jgi:protoporphyrinogen oxidase
MEIKILGAGISGLSAAYYLEKHEIDYELFEKENSIGGLCKTLRLRNFSFDTALHVIHLNDPKIEKLLMRLLGNDLLLHKRKSLVYFNGETIPYPFQVFFPLLSDKKIVQECFEGINQRNCEQRSKSNVSNFYELCIKSFGSGITNYFMEPYNRKLFQTDLTNLSWQWAERFVPRINIKDVYEIKKDKLNKIRNNYGYNVSFWYPKRGIDALPRALLNKIAERRVHLNQETRRISLSNKTIEFTDGTVKKWDILISSIPLPLLLSIIEDLPNSIKYFIEKLTWVSVYNLNLGISGKSPYDAHWIYFPNKQYRFYRIGFPSSLSPNMCPEGSYSLSVETSFIPNFPPNLANWKKQIYTQLLKAKFLPSKLDICVTCDLVIPYAYVVPDLNYLNFRSVILSFLLKHSIINIGRYGLWEYSSIQDAILEGEEAACLVSKTTENEIGNRR